MGETSDNSKIVIYEADDGQTKIQVKIENETVLFKCSVDNISLHLKNIFKTKGLDENSVVRVYCQRIYLG